MPQTPPTPGDRARPLRGPARRRRWVAAFIAASVLGPVVHGVEVTAQALLEGALDLTRGVASHTEMTMTIHRPDWQRRITVEAWTRGREDALIRFTAPAKDAGTATLKKGQRMWTFTPKLQREIRLPASMMSQSWAGSDFSYNDLARTDKYLRHYHLAIAAASPHEGHTVYTLELTPHDDAPVVWGKEVMELRDDYVLLRQTYYDQALAPVKALRTLAVGELGGRTIALRMRMADVGDEARWTEIHYHKANFDAAVEDAMFTTFALRGGR